MPAHLGAQVSNRYESQTKTRRQKRATDVENGPVSIDTRFVLNGGRKETVYPRLHENYESDPMWWHPSRSCGRVWSYRSLRLVASLVAGTLSNRKLFFLPINTDHVFGIHRGTLAL